MALFKLTSQLQSRQVFVLISGEQKRSEYDRVTNLRINDTYTEIHTKTISIFKDIRKNNHIRAFFVRFETIFHISSYNRILPVI